jgi:hypothetical protein
MMRLISAAVAASALLFVATPVLADASSGENDPCGKFDFRDGFNCKIEVEGGCQAQCTPLSFKAGCTGGCTATATTACTGSCGTACIAECDPSLLDCFAGCHAECDAEVQAQCESKGGTDCQEQAVAQCDMHCETSCEVPPSDCSEHCKSCCNGGCTTQANFDCDFDCFAELKGGCDVQCSKPEGALFCNGQYVYASDIKECIAWLATQGFEVDASASASLSCDGGDCNLAGALDACTAGGIGADVPDAEGLLAMMFVGLGIAVRRRRKA